MHPILRNIIRTEMNLAGMKISLDFNDTFNTARGKQLAQRLIGLGYDVHIVTRLNENNRMSVENYVKKSGLSIPSNRIHFTNGQLKYNKLKELGIKRHYDNSQKEIDAINKFTPFIEGVKF